jgi:hypothetical protein|nr:MAG TPA: hypothetical protein [Caudoviricetes sp.]
MKDVMNLCFNDSEISIEKLDEVIEALHNIDSNFWNSSEEYLSWSIGKQPVTWLERGSSNTLDINGGDFQEHPYREIVTFEEWFPLAMAKIKGE